MRINHKQQELIDLSLDKVKKEFPEVTFKNITFSPEDSDYIWVNVVAEMEEDRHEEYINFVSELEADIDIAFGYRISIRLENQRLVFA